MPSKTTHLHTRLLTLALAAGIAHAQPAPLEAEADAPPGDAARDLPASGWDADARPQWRVRFEPAAWFVAPSGDISVPTGAGTASGPISFDALNLDDPVFAPFGELHIARDAFRLTISGVGVSADSTTPTETDFEFQSFYVAGSYRFADYADGFTETGGRKFELGLDAMLGFQFHRLDIEVDGVGGDEAIFGEVLGGLRADMTFYERFGLDVYTTFAGFSTGDRSSFTFDIGVGFVYRPIQTVGAQIGYRLLLVDFQGGESDEIEWDGQLAGLYWGVQVTF